MQVREWNFTDSFVELYETASLKLGKPIRFVTGAWAGCPNCPDGCSDAKPREVAVVLDPGWTSRQAQQYATRAIYHHVITWEGFPTVRLHRSFSAQEAARALCYRFNWRVLGLVVDQRTTGLFSEPDFLLTELFVNTVKYINVCHEHPHSGLELSVPALDIFYQYFSLRPRHQKQLAGVVKHKWAQVHRLVWQMIRLSENYSVMDPDQCADMLEALIELLKVGEIVQVVRHPQKGERFQHDRRAVEIGLAGGFPAFAVPTPE